MSEQAEHIVSTLRSSDLRLMTVAEAAAEMGVGTTKLRMLIQEGEITTMPWGNEHRIPVWELRRWQESMMEQQRQGRKVISFVDTLGTRARYRGRKP